LDQDLPAPAFGDAATSFSRAYSRLFAIWLGTDKQCLLLPSQGSASANFPGFRIEQEARIFRSKPTFIISEAILVSYILASILVYLGRPGKHLARLPTSIAAIIALFASSSAIGDLRKIAHMSKA
jgi:hypothetical protein